MCNISIPLPEFLNLGVSSSVVGVSDESRFEKPDEVGLVCRGSQRRGGIPSGRMAGHEVRESGERPQPATTRRVRMWVGLGGWQSRGVWISVADEYDLMGLLP
jgi:hypothetical protein